MAAETQTLLIVLGSVFLFILIVFLSLLSCFTWRGYRARRTRTAHVMMQTRGGGRVIPSSEMHGKEDRWSTKTRGDRRMLYNKDDAAAEEYTGQEGQIQQEHAIAGQVNEDGTRSYLNGWFALARPVNTVGSFSSSDLERHSKKIRNSSVNSRGQHKRIGEAEWEANSEDDLDDEDDKEAYRPLHALPE